MPFSNTNEFDSYTIAYFTPTRSASPYGPKTIVVSLFKGSTEVGQLQFYPDAYSTVPKDFIWNMGTISLFFRESQFDDVITILREEKPLYVYIRTSVNTTASSGKLEGAGQIMTSREPVGEEEGA